MPRRHRYNAAEVNFLEAGKVTHLMTGELMHMPPGSKFNSNSDIVMKAGKSSGSLKTCWTTSSALASGASTFATVIARVLGE